VNANDVPLYRCAGYVVEFALIDSTSNAKCNHLCRNTIHRYSFQPVSLHLHVRIKQFCNKCLNSVFIYLPRDAMRKRGHCCRPVSGCLSVCPSRWCIVSRRLKISLNFFFWPGSPMILVLCIRAPIPNTKGNPFNGYATYKGLEKFCDFRLKSQSISETVRDRSMVTIER